MPRTGAPAGSVHPGSPLLHVQLVFLDSAQLTNSPKTSLCAPQNSGWVAGLAPEIPLR